MTMRRQRCRSPARSRWAADLIGGPDTFAWTLDPADAARRSTSMSPARPASARRSTCCWPDGTRLARASLGYDGHRSYLGPPAAAGDLHHRLSRAPATSRHGTCSGPPRDDPGHRCRAQRLPTQAVPLDPVDAHGTRPAADPHGCRLLLLRAGRGARDHVDRHHPRRGRGGRPDRSASPASTGRRSSAAQAAEGVRLSSLELTAGTWTLQVSGDGDPDSRYEVRVAAGSPRHRMARPSRTTRDDLADAWDMTDGHARHVPIRRCGRVPGPRRPRTADDLAPGSSRVATCPRPTGDSPTARTWAA